jgi:hypothetical protein
MGHFQKARVHNCTTRTVTSADNTREHSLSQSLGLNSGPIWVCKKKKQAQKKTQNRRSIIIYESCCNSLTAEQAKMMTYSWHSSYVLSSISNSWLPSLPCSRLTAPKHCAQSQPRSWLWWAVGYPRRTLRPRCTENDDPASG